MISKIIKVTGKVMVGFFIIIFILGIFSKQVISFFVPQVFVSYPSRNPVTKTVQTKCEILPMEKDEIKISADLEIEKYYVKAGEQINKNTKLFKLKNPNLIAEEMLYLKSNIAEIEESIESKKLQNLESKYIENVLENQILNAGEKLDEYGFIERVENIKIRDKAIEEHNKKELENEESYISRLNGNGYNNREKFFELEKLELEKKLSEFEVKNDIYFDDNGICYSKNDALVFFVNEKMQLKENDTIVELTEIKDTCSLKAQVKLSYEQYIWLSYIPKMDVLIGNEVYAAYTYDKYNDEAGNIVIDTFFQDLDIPYLVPGAKYDCVMKYKVQNPEAAAIPKMIIEAPNGFKEGSYGFINTVDIKEGILGKEAIAKKKKIDFIFVGDDAVLVEAAGIGRIITTPSDKIQNGKKVFLN